MPLPLETELEKRIADIEAALGSMQLSLDSMARALNSRLEQSAEPVNAPAKGRRADLPSNASTPPVAPRPTNAGHAQPVARPSARRAPPPDAPDTPAGIPGEARNGGSED